MGPARRELASRMARTFDAEVPLNAWRVRLSASDDLLWEERRDGGVVLHHTEPGAGRWRRLGVAILSVLPIDPLL